MPRIMSKNVTMPSFGESFVTKWLNIGKLENKFEDDGWSTYIWYKSPLTHTEILLVGLLGVTCLQSWFSSSSVTVGRE